MPAWTEESSLPPSSKPHNDVKLQSTHVYEPAQQADSTRTSANPRDGHRPLEQYYGDENRKADTHSVYGQDDSLSNERPQRQEGSDPEELDWRERLESPDFVVSVRDVMRASPDYKIIKPVNHASFARYVLPVAESEIKNQEWPDKPVGQRKEGVDYGYPNQSAKENGRQIINNQTAHASHLPVLTSITPQEQEFIDKVIEEGRVIKSLKNNPGVPNGELKPIDCIAHRQLENHLSGDDQSTPDSWVPRYPGLLRLTGVHPLNAEPNLTEVFDAGMITPTKLHYVRSHSTVPRLAWETHRLSVCSDPPGLIAKPKDWTMDELTLPGAFTMLEFPVTFGCSGNRRKEVNMIKKTAFNWSSAAVSTCLWRGIRVRDILLACGLQDQPDEERWYLNIIGADVPPKGSYATSVPLMYVKDLANDVMLVFGMNGRVLHPDHGYPLRIIIPGFIGGRQVKWLKQLCVTKEPLNDSHYYMEDNRVVPTFIGSKSHPFANAFFKHESAVVHEQCLQSVIVKPAHGERIPLTKKGSLDVIYTVEGYAFNGGGGCVDRVEISLDGGITWRYCFRTFMDSPLRHGEKYWAWIFWSCQVSFGDLVDAQEIIVRAQDSRKNYQPEHISWNVMGTMNNAWYRVRHKITQDPETSLPVVQFIHPVAPGNGEGGWMVSPQEYGQTDDGQDNSEIPVFSLEEIAKHNKEDDAWIILDNKVYDVTSVLGWHPGGKAAILAYAGKITVDATNAFNGIHDDEARMARDGHLIGALTEEGIKAMEENAIEAAERLAELKGKQKGKALQPDVFTQAKLVKRTEITADIRLYTFELPCKEDGSHGELGLPVGQHIQVSIHFSDQAVLRSYTPVRPVLVDEEDGTFDLLVKTYLPSESGPFAPGGTVSNYLDCMTDDEEIDIRGPCGGITYQQRSVFDIEGRTYHFNKINLIAGGSRLTPHWQLIHAILSDKDDTTTVSLIDVNKTYNDILLREELQKYADKYPERFKLWHVLETPPEEEDFPCSKGNLDQDIMEEHFYSAGDGVVTLMCGPPDMIESIALPGLRKMGFKDGETMFGFR